jgi:hypothetical protein
MPIRPENKVRYPKDWPSISATIRTRANNCCEWCGVKNYALGGRGPVGTFYEALPKGERLLRLDWPVPGETGMCKGYPEPLRIIRIVLTVAHLDQKPENCDPANLACLCQRCHNRHDQFARIAGRKARQRRGAAISDFFAEEA